MESIEITSISSRGQVVIPMKIRERLNLQEGEKFVVMGKGDTIIFKKLGIPSFKGFDELLKKTHEHARKHGLTEKDLLDAIKRVRSKKNERQ